METLRQLGITIAELNLILTGIVAAALGVFVQMSGGSGWDSPLVIGFVPLLFSGIGLSMVSIFISITGTDWGSSYIPSGILKKFSETGEDNPILAPKEASEISQNIHELHTIYIQKNEEKLVEAGAVVDVSLVLLLAGASYYLIAIIEYILIRTRIIETIPPRESNFIIVLFVVSIYFLLLPGVSSSGKHKDTHPIWVTGKVLLENAKYPTIFGNSKKIWSLIGARFNRKEPAPVDGIIQEDELLMFLKNDKRKFSQMSPPASDIPAAYVVTTQDVSQEFKCDMYTARAALRRLQKRIHRDKVDNFEDWEILHNTDLPRHKQGLWCLLKDPVDD